MRMMKETVSGPPRRFAIQVIGSVLFVAVLSAVPTTLLTIAHINNGPIFAITSWVLPLVALGSAYAVYWRMMRTGTMSPPRAAWLRIALCALAPLCLAGGHLGPMAMAGPAPVIAVVAACASLFTGRLVRAAAEDRQATLYVFFFFLTFVVGFALFIAIFIALFAISSATGHNVP
jgi:hypothetical protein